jgi:hypothetical protein
LPPLAWDDDTIDEPDATPAVVEDQGDVDEVLVQRALWGERVNPSLAERRAITARWMASGRSLNKLERIQGWRARRYLEESA